MPATAAADSMWTRSLEPFPLATLQGDRMNLPSECLESITSDSRNAHPLTFRLLNPITRSTVYASVREFTAPEGVVQISSLLQECLGPNKESKNNENGAPTAAAVAAPAITVTLVTLPPGVHAKLAPLEASYLEIADIRAVLETHLRKHHATLTKGQTLCVEDISRDDDDDDAVGEKKAVDGVVILNQDVTVDIVPMDDALAEQAVRNKFAIPAAADGGSNGALVWDTDGRAAATKATVFGEYTLEVIPTAGDADLFVSTLMERPTIQDHTKYDVDAGKSTVSIECNHAVTPVLYIGVLSVDAPSSEFELHVRAAQVKPATATSEAEEQQQAAPTSDGSTIQCENCHVHIRAATHQLHLAYCLRHNALCPTCHTAFPKAQLSEHWHCSFCSAQGTTLAGQKKHAAAAGTAAMSPTDAAVAVVKLIGESSVGGNSNNPKHFLCVLVADTRALKRKVAADWLVGMGFAVGWALKALIACGDDGEAALAWLGANAP
ncbi:ubiquitin fusion degradation protein UFD1-domain-containing protein, partial [Geranomyces variabilis]